MLKLLKSSILLKTLLFLFVCLQLQCQSFKGYEWQTLDCIGEPVARHEAGFVEVDDKFYLMGGRRIQEISIFDPKTKIWTSGAKPPIELHHFQGFSYKGDIYAIGAHTGQYPHETPVQESYIYKPKLDTWEAGFKLPKDRVRASTGNVVYKDKLYMAGGILDGHWDGHVTWFDSYDFKTGKWEKLPDIPRPRDHYNAVVSNNKLYLLGGRVTSGSEKKVFDLTVKEVDVFDFKTGKWSTLDTPIVNQRAGCMAISINNKILLVGGESITQKEAHNEVESLDTKTGKWTTLSPLNKGRHGSQLIWHNKKLYVASGCGNRGGKPELITIECFAK